MVSMGDDMKSNSAALASLTATYTDSDASDDEGHPRTPASRLASPLNESSRQSTSESKDTGGSLDEAKPVSSLVSYVEDVSKEDEDEDDKINDSPFAIPNSKTVMMKIDDMSTDSVKDYTSSLLLKNSIDEIKLFTEPPGHCSNHLQGKIADLYNKMQQSGLDMNESIQQRKSFRNPSIYEKLISYCGIDELGTNYPPKIYNPHRWQESSFYEELAKCQKAEMDKRQKERTKVEFVSGTKKSSSVTSTASTTESQDGKRKSKWDEDEGKKRLTKWDVGSAPSVAVASVVKTVGANPPGIVPVSTTASGTKATVISAFGTISKPKK